MFQKEYDDLLNEILNEKIDSLPSKPLEIESKPQENANKTK